MPTYGDDRPVQTGATSGDTTATSAAAAFALVIGLAALFCALTAILSPAAVLFDLIGIVLGIVGLKWPSGQASPARAWPSAVW